MHNAAMTKEEYRKAIEQLPRGVLIGSETVELPIADYPAAWQVRQIHY